MGENLWIELHDISRAKALFLLPCNAAACAGNYFRADVYRQNGWNTWREADKNLHDLRAKGRVAFAAVDSSILETEPEGPLGPIVLENEMRRVKNPKGEDWGAPSWRWFRPNPAGEWNYLEQLTEALVRGIRRVERLNFPQVIALVNPRGYYLALAAAAAEAGVLDKWIIFHVPAHPRYLIPAVREVAPLIRAAATGKKLPGGIYHIPKFLWALDKEKNKYKDKLPPQWYKYSLIPKAGDAQHRWPALTSIAERKEKLNWN